MSSKPDSGRPSLTTVPRAGGASPGPVRMSVYGVPLKIFKIVAFTCGFVFVLLTVANLVLTSLALQIHLRRISQINVGYQIIFLMPFIPFVFGLLFENRELLVPFFIVNCYSAIYSAIMIILLHFNLDDKKDLQRVMAVFTFIIFVAPLSAFIIFVLFNTFIKMKNRKVEIAETEFNVNSYSLKRYGDIVSLDDD